MSDVSAPPPHARETSGCGQFFRHATRYGWGKPGHVRGTTLTKDITLRWSRTPSRGDQPRPDGRLSNSRVAAEAAVTLRPIPREAIRAGGTVVASMAMRRAGLESPRDPLPRTAARSDRAPRRPAAAPRTGSGREGQRAADHALPPRALPGETSQHGLRRRGTSLKQLHPIPMDREEQLGNNFKLESGGSQLRVPSRHNKLRAGRTRPLRRHAPWTMSPSTGGTASDPRGPGRGPSTCAGVIVNSRRPCRRQQFLALPVGRCQT